MDVLKNHFRAAVSCLLLLGLVLAAGTAITIANGNASQKQKVVAGAIYNFIKFIDWQSAASDRQPFALCLQRYDAAFEPFKQRQVRGKDIQLSVLDAGQAPERCDAVYLNAESAEQDHWLQAFKRLPVLTISERPGFAERGGVIELGEHNNRLIFTINQTAAKAVRLNVGFQLLSLARKVIEP